MSAGASREGIETGAKHRAWGRLALVGSLVLLLVNIVFPIDSTLTRAANVALGLLTLLLALALAWRRPRVRGALVVVALLPLSLLLPGRPPDPAVLEAAYSEALLGHDGERYVWGGEGRLGIDCSGLVRRALFEALVRTGVRTLNPRCVREALDLWWHDGSAHAMGEEYRAVTRRVGEARSLNEMDPGVARVGDLAVTRSGVHVLACLGDGEWIQADPGAGRVVVVRAPDTRQGWLAQPVRIVRWRLLDDAGD